MAPWVDLRHSLTSISLLIEEPKAIQSRSDGSRYVVAELELQNAKNLCEDLARRIREVEGDYKPRPRIF